MTIDELKDKVQRFDAERLRILEEINKRKRDLKRFAASITEDLRRSETQKISNLEDILEDIEYDLTACLEQLFELVDPETDIPEGDLMFDTMLEEKSVDTRATDEGYQKLVEKRDQVAQDLATYKAAYRRLMQDADDLMNIIESAELELDDIIADLAEQSQES